MRDQAKTRENHFWIYGILWLVAFGVGAALEFGTNIPALPEFSTGFLFVFGYWAFFGDPAKRSIRTLIGFPVLTGLALVGLGTVWGLVFG